MSPKPQDRPREVTLGVIAVVIVGVLVIARAFDALNGLGSLATQKSLRHALDSDSARQLGVTVAELTDVLHAMILVGAAATAVSMVMALYAVTGHRPARWGLFVSGIIGAFGTLMFEPLMGLFLGVAAVFATVSPRAAAWFDGATPPPPPPPRGRDNREPFGTGTQDSRHPAPPPAQHPGNPPEPDDRDRRTPRAVPDFGQYQPPAVMTATMPYATRSVQTPVVPSEEAPASVRAAVLLTWGGCLATVLAAIGGLVALIADRAPMVDWATHWLDLGDSPVPTGWIAAGLVVALLAVAACAVLASAMATFVHLGNAGARMLLVTDAVIAVLAGLTVLTSAGVSAIAVLMSSLVLLDATAVIVLLLSPSAVRHFSR